MHWIVKESLLNLSNNERQKFIVKGDSKVSFRASLGGSGGMPPQKNS